MRLDVFAEQRLFEPCYTKFAERRGGLDRRVDFITLIGIGHDREIFAQLSPDGADNRNVLREIEADLNFERVKSLLCQSHGLLHDALHSIRIERRGVNPHFLSTRSTEQLIDREPFYFSQNIPERDINAAQGYNADPARAQCANATTEIGFVPYLLDIARVHSDQQGFEDSVHDNFNEHPVPGAGANAGD